MSLNGQATSCGNVIIVNAYQIAVKNGFKGTETEWLESLKGKDGEPGKDGTPGRDGQPGPQGAPGYTPQKGKDYFTEPDKQEIAEIAAGLVEVPEGGGGEWELLQECDFDAETKAVEITENIADISEIIVVMQNTGTANFTFGWTGHKVNGKNFTTLAGVQLGANKKYFSHLYLSPICYAISAHGLGTSYTADSAKAAYISDGAEIGAINILEEYKFFVATGSNAHVWIYCKRKGC